MKPIKPFLTYDQQVDHLVKKKGLTISDADAAKDALSRISYYALIGGYKNLFYNPMTRTYLQGTTFDDILVLYHFDDALRDLVFKNIRIIEQEMRSMISYYFCETYSNLQTDYLDPGHYINTKNSRSDIQKLINVLTYEAYRDIDHPYIVYQRNTYGNVPLWAVMKTLTLGQTSKMYSLLYPQVKSKISKNFVNVNESDLIKFLKVLTHFRNVCAHNERLFSYVDRNEIPDTVLHKKLKIQQKGTHYICGKSDLFSVVIALRYLLPRKSFLVFKKALVQEIGRTVKNASTLTEDKLLSAMGFPENWRDITRYKM
ncbi:MAG TPA: abortive phage resistance protein [Lachnospiraceae bacterium]|jgi:abortive infection bacteriophage resistance protein|nr:abortive phage resistance protein [Lachnospiraceae bacterium]